MNKITKVRKNVFFLFISELKLSYNLSNMSNRVSDLLHLFFPHASHRHDRCAHAYTTRVERARWFVRNSIFIQCYTSMIEGFLHEYTTSISHIREDQMVARTASHYGKSFFHERFRECMCITNDLVIHLSKFWSKSLSERYGDGKSLVVVWTSLKSWKY